MNATTPVANLSPAKRKRIALTAATKPGVLDELANDQHWHTRFAVANNPTTPEETLTRLAADQTYMVRRGTAENNHTSASTLTALSADPNTIVRFAVAKNPNTPPDTLTRLANDPAPAVRQQAEHTRKHILDEHINTLTGTAREHAQLLAPTFTGWPDDLDELLGTLTEETGTP